MHATEPSDVCPIGGEATLIRLAIGISYGFRHSVRQSGAGKHITCVMPSAGR